MIKYCYTISLVFILIVFSFTTIAQNNIIDSLRKLLQVQKESKEWTDTLNEKSSSFLNNDNYKAALACANEALAVAARLQYKTGEATAYIRIAEIKSGLAYTGDAAYSEAIISADKALNIFKAIGSSDGIAQYYYCYGDIYRLQGNSSEALKNFSTALNLCNKTGNKKLSAQLHWLLGQTYNYDLANYPEALKHFYTSLKLWEELGNPEEMSKLRRNIGMMYYSEDNIAEATINFDSAQKISERAGDKKGLASANRGLGDVYQKQGNDEAALKKYTETVNFFKQAGIKNSAAFAYFGIGNIYERQAAAEVASDSGTAASAKYKIALDNYLLSIQFGRESNDKGGLGYYYAYASSVYTKLSKLDSAEKYAALSMQISRELGTTDNYEKSYAALVQLDSARGDYEKAYQHYKTYILYRDSIINQESSLKSLMHKMQYETEKNQAIAQAEKEKKDAEQRRNRNLQYAVSGIFLVLAVFLFWNNRLKQNSKRKIEKAYDQLKSTQAQLVQSEKMASLGELTAGIAHEIQNPLNFVNNFSEINSELIDELKTELATGNTQLAGEIADDIKDNSEKINHHGKRADAIVKGMLQHSRTSTGVKELTNINDLADEYLRLAYHGLRARDKSFNVTMKTNFDGTIGKINIVSQDIGRVILNLITNAFYAASLPSRGGFSDSGSSKIPTVWVSTKKAGDTVLISVKDNGPGIPQKILDKIFQPFFTTKPTGQGTGLGLSISYDIIKAHGGEIKVETKEGEGTEFIISLSLKDMH